MQIPTYRHFKARNRGFAEHQGKRTYFPGAYDSDESREAYQKFVAAIASDGVIAQQLETGQLTLTALSVLYLRHAKTYYGTGPRSPSAAAELAIRDILFAGQGWEDMLVNDVSPKVIKAMQQYLSGRKLAKTKTDKTLSRTTINYRISWIRRMMRWGVSEEHVRSDVYQALMTVRPLQRGRTDAPEPPPRQAVEWHAVEAALGQLPPHLQTMVWLQWYTGVRSGTLVRARREEFYPDPANTGLWIWNPKHHKTERLGHELIIPLGPQCQERVMSTLERVKSGYLFRPKETDRSKRAGEHYSVQSYRRALVRAQDRVIRKAGLGEVEGAKLRWTPHQMRHARGHMVRERYGVEGVQSVLGHASVGAAQVYSSRRIDLAKQIAVEMG